MIETALLALQKLPIVQSSTLIYRGAVSELACLQVTKVQHWELP